MKTPKALLGATALVALGLVPQLARAQLEYCVAGYTDYYVDTTQGEIEAWTWIEDYFNDGGYCSAGGAYLWGYFEHGYYAWVSIESPTGRTATDDDSVLMPYGGGSASASTALSYSGDAGQYIIEWFITLGCSIGGTIVYWLDDDSIAVTPDCSMTTFETQLFDNFLVRSSTVRGWHNFSLQDGVFGFSAEVWSAAPDIAMVMEAFKSWENLAYTSCSGTLAISGSVNETSNPIARISVSTVGELTYQGQELCGLMQQESNPWPRDKITIVTQLGGGNPIGGPWQSCVQRPDITAKHEFGHLLGFERKNTLIHAVLDPTDIMFGAVTPGQTILPRHARILVEKYTEAGL